MPPSKEINNFKKIKSVFFVGTVFILAIAFLYLIAPFFYPIFWAMIIALMFYPVYTFTNYHTKMPNLSAGLTVIIVAATILLPLILISLLVIDQSIQIFTLVNSGDILLRIKDLLLSVTQVELLEPVAQTIQNNWTTYATNATETVTVFLLNNLRSMTQNSFHFVFQLFITLYTLFFFLRDGRYLVDKLLHLSPIGDEYEIKFLERFTSTIKATLKGTFIIGGLQGLIGTILFAATGVQGALIWGIFMTLSSLIPGIGSFAVWGPVGLIMLGLGNVWEGLTILGVGAFVISIVDNILRPPLVGRDTQMHPLIILFATLGGIILFGISGFIIGPILAGLFLSAVSMYEYFYERELRNN